MRMRPSWIGAIVVVAAVGAAAAAIGEAQAAAPPKPVAGQQVHFPEGTWSAVPQAGPDGKVTQCVLVAPRPRAGPSAPIGTALSLIIGHGAGLSFAIMDDKIPPEAILDDEGEIILNGVSHPADAFTVTTNDLAFHPGDAAAVLAALAKTTTLEFRSAGARIDTGPIALDLPAEALAWLTQCGQMFNIAIDRPTDPNAPPLPAPQPPSPKIASGQATAAGPAGIEIKEKIGTWDASELRNGDGTVGACVIRQHFNAGPSRAVAIFFAVSGSKGLTMVLKDSVLKMTAEQRIQATLTIDDKPSPAFSARALSGDEIGIFPQDGAALAQALGDGVAINFKSPVEGMEFSTPGGILPWLRACGNRWGFGFAPALTQAKP